MPHRKISLHTLIVGAAVLACIRPAETVFAEADNSSIGGWNETAHPPSTVHPESTDPLLHGMPSAEDSPIIAGLDVLYSPPASGADPGVAWMTFLGGSGYDYTSSTALDADGNFFVAGSSDSSWGSPIEPFHGGFYDSFVARIDPEGGLVWNTFLGGSAGQEFITNIAVDGNGDILVAGYATASWGSPINPYSWNNDGFTAKLDSDGGLIWNTFIGGDDSESISDMAVDGSGNIYLTGKSTGSWGSPVRPFTAVIDGFAAEIDADGSLLWNTFLGGSGQDYAFDIDLDAAGNPYVSGYSTVTWGYPVRAFSGNYDAFAVRLGSDGALTWNTFLGGSGDDRGYSITLDAGGNIYLLGSGLASWGSPTHPFNGSADILTAGLDPDGTLLWNSFAGGSGSETGVDITVGGGDRLFAVAECFANWGSPLRPYSGGADSCAMELDATGGVVWSTFLGGSSDDLTPRCVADDAGHLFVVGKSNVAWGNPIRPFGSGGDGYLAKLDVNPPAVSSIVRTGADPANAAVVDFAVTFTESVSGVDAGDFAIAAAGIAGASVEDVSGSGTAFTVAVGTGSGNGTIRLDLVDDDSVRDAAGNALGGAGAGNGDYSAGEAYTIDKTPPAVSSIVRAGADPTGAASVDFTVTFTESVSGADAGDFALTAAGVSGASVTGFSGSGASYTVTVDTGSGNGTIRLDLVDDDSIRDAAGNALGGAGAGNGGFTGGESYTVEKSAPGAFAKLAPSAAFVPADPTLAWETSDGAAEYEYCIDASNDDLCGSVWISAGTATSVGLSGLGNNDTYYWQVRATNGLGTTGADGGFWATFTSRIQRFADVPIDHTLWKYIDAFAAAGISTGCGVSPLRFCPEQNVTRAAMAVFLLRAKYGASYTPPPAAHYFSDMPVAGKEWMEPWVDQVYREGITTGCGTSPLIFCPENSVTRAAMAVFLLRAKYGSSYTPPALSHFFSDLPVAGKEWQEAWVDQVYREGVTSGCGYAPLIFCPEDPVKRQAMAAFIVRAFNLPLP